MFNRLRYAVTVLRGHRLEPITSPDVVFVENEPTPTKRSSKILGDMIEIALFGCSIAYVGHFIGSVVFPGKSSASVGTWSSVIGAALAIIYNYFLEGVNRRIKADLRLGQKLAPYFGHKLDSAYRTIKGLAQ